MQATSFDDIERKALNRVLDFDIPFMSGEVSDAILDSYLESAETYISEVYEDIDFSKDTETRTYNRTLEPIVVEMLTTGLIYFWMLPKLLNTQQLKNNLSTSDFNLYSPANLLKQLQEITDTLHNQFESLVVDYGYRHGVDGSTIADLQV